MPEDESGEIEKSTIDPPATSEPPLPDGEDSHVSSAPTVQPESRKPATFTENEAVFDRSASFLACALTPPCDASIRAAKRQSTAIEDKRSNLRASRLIRGAADETKQDTPLQGPCNYSRKGSVECWGPGEPQDHGLGEEVHPVDSEEDACRGEEGHGGLLPLPVSNGAITRAGSDPAPGASVCWMTLDDTLRAGFCLAALQPGGQLDTRLRRRQRDDARQATTNVLQTPRPLLPLLNKLWFQAVLLAFVAGTLYFAATALAADAGRRGQRVVGVRFTALEERGGGEAAGAHIAGLGLLRRGCTVRGRTESVSEVGATLTVLLGEVVEADGYFFVTAEDEPERDPVRFKVEVAGEGGGGGEVGEWAVVGSSGARGLHDGSVTPMTHRRFPLPEERGAEVKVGLGMPVPWFIGWVAANAAIAGGVLAAVLLAASGREQWAMGSLQVGWLAGAALRVGGAGGFFWRGNWEEGLYWALQAVGQGLLGLGLTASGGHFVMAITALGLYLVAVEAVVDFGVYGEKGPPAGNVPFLGVCLSVLGAGFLVLRLRRRGEAYARIEADRQALHKAWENLVDPPEQEEAEAEEKNPADWRESWRGSKHFSQRIKAVSSEEMARVAQSMAEVEAAEARAKRQEEQQRSMDVVQSTWALVEQDLDAHGVRFFLRIFEIAPPALELFSFRSEVPIEESPGMRKHATSVMRTVGRAVGGLSDLNALVPVLEALGATHAKFGVQPEHFGIVGEALLWTLEQGLGELWTAEVREAWASTYGTVQSVMEPALKAKIHKLDAAEGLRKLKLAIDKTGGGHRKLVRQYLPLGSGEEEAGLERQAPGLSLLGRQSRLTREVRHARLRAAEGLSLRRPVQSLDQLYAQAAVANCVLRGKAGEWAGKSHGLVAAARRLRADSSASLSHSPHGIASPSRTSPFGRGRRQAQAGAREEAEWVRWSDAASHPALKARVQWRGLKEADRAIEKVLLCYDADVSRLCDIAGQRIVFDTVKDLAKCMDAIALDGDVTVSYVKNYMETPNASGFRAVVVYLRFDNPEARRLAVQTHVCEVQLVLRTFVKLQSAHQHLRYVAFRNDISAGGAHTPLLAGLSERLRLRLRWVLSHRRVAPAPAPALPASKGRKLSLFEATKGSGPLDRPASDTPSHRGLDGQLPVAPGASLEAEVSAFLQVWSGLAAGAPGDAVQRTVCLATSMQHVSVISAAFSSKAAAAIASKRKWQLLVLLVAVAYFAWGIPALLAASDPSAHAFRGSVFRFTSLQDREGRPPEAPHVRELALLLGGCEVEGAASAAEEDGPTLTVWFDDVVEANGFSFVTAADRPERDPMRFKLEILEEEGAGEEKLVGSSQWRVQSTGAVELLGGCCFETPRERLATVAVQPQAGWPWLLAFVGVQGVTSVCALVFGGLGVRGRPEQCAPLLTVGFAAVGSLQVAAGAGFAAAGARAEAAYWLLFAVGNVGMAGVVRAAEGWLVPALTCAGAYWVVLDVVFKVTWWRVAGLYESPPLTGLGLLVVGAAVMAVYRVRRERATRLIEADRAGYDKLWADITADGAAMEALRRLDEEAAAVQPKLDEAFVRQFAARNHELCAAEFHEQLQSGCRADEAAALSMRGMTREDRVPQLAPPVRLLRRSIVDVRYGVQKVGHALKAVAGALRPRHADVVPTPTRARSLERDRELHLEMWSARRLQSLDQIFAQAHAANVLLKRKVQEWALVSEGCFAFVDADGRTSFVPWSELQDAGAEVQCCIKWGKVKGVDRAVEKVLRTYGGDASRLLDVCRQCIVFTRITNLLDCFNAITSDPNINLLRVKNRLGLRYDSSQSAGYRDIVLNLSVNSEAARSMYVSTHVCEVQLLLSDFARMKSDEGHRRYKRFRDERCE